MELFNRRWLYEKVSVKHMEAVVRVSDAAWT